MTAPPSTTTEPDIIIHTWGGFSAKIPWVLKPEPRISMVMSLITQQTSLIPSAYGERLVVGVDLDGGARKS
jgi:hypothetical protein